MSKSHYKEVALTYDFGREAFLESGVEWGEAVASLSSMIDEAQQGRLLRALLSGQLYAYDGMVSQLMCNMKTHKLQERLSRSNPCIEQV